MKFLFENLTILSHYISAVFSHFLLLFFLVPPPKYQKV